MLISAAKPARPFDEEPDLDVFATLANAACLTRAGEVSRGLLIGWLSSTMASPSSEEKEIDGAGGLAFLFPFEGRRDIRTVESEWRKLGM